MNLTVVQAALEIVTCGHMKNHQSDVINGI